MTVEMEAEVFRILSWSLPMGLRRVMENSTLLTEPHEHEADGRAT